MDLFVAFIFAIGSVICHQRPERSFFLDGHQFPVCARCTGLYLSAAVGLLGWVVFKMASRWRRVSFDPRLPIRVIAIAAIPTAVSWTTGVTGIWDGSNITRALLAIPLGASAGAIVAAVATKDLR
jgi:uncharacterized membrane protein